MKGKRRAGGRATAVLLAGLLLLTWRGARAVGVSSEPPGGDDDALAAVRAQVDEAAANTRAVLAAGRRPTLEVQWSAGGERHELRTPEDVAQAQEEMGPDIHLAEILQWLDQEAAPSGDLARLLTLTRRSRVFLVLKPSGDTHYSGEDTVYLDLRTEAGNQDDFDGVLLHEFTHLVSFDRMQWGSAGFPSQTDGRSSSGELQPPDLLGGLGLLKEMIISGDHTDKEYGFTDTRIAFFEGLAEAVEVSLAGPRDREHAWMADYRTGVGCVPSDKADASEHHVEFILGEYFAHRWDRIEKVLTSLDRDSMKSSSDFQAHFLKEHPEESAAFLQAVNSDPSLCSY